MNLHPRTGLTEQQMAMRRRLIVQAVARWRHRQRAATYFEAMADCAENDATDVAEMIEQGEMLA